MYTNICKPRTYNSLYFPIQQQSFFFCFVFLRSFKISYYKIAPLFQTIAACLLQVTFFNKGSNTLRN